MHVNISILNTKLSALTLALIFVLSVAGSSWAQGTNQRQDHLIKRAGNENPPTLNAFEHVSEAGRWISAFNAWKNRGAGSLGNDLPDAGVITTAGDSTGTSNGDGGGSGSGSGGSGNGEFDRLGEDRPAFGMNAMAEQPREAAVVGNYPNPFNPETTIRFEVRVAQQVQLAVYNALGQRVRVLVNDRVEAGAHEARFDAYGLPSGTYFSRLITEAGVVTRTMVLAR